MAPQIHIGAVEAQEAQDLRLEDVIERMDTADLEALAALAGAPAGVAELAFSAFPPGTRLWMLTYGLAEEDKEGQLLITDRGWRAIELASERCPEPYADVSLEDVMASTLEAINQLVARSGVRVREPAALPPRAAPTSSPRQAGRAIASSVFDSAGRVKAKKASPRKGKGKKPARSTKRGKTAS
jgi:hypothetical protein